MMTTKKTHRNQKQKQNSKKKTQQNHNRRNRNGQGKHGGYALRNPSIGWTRSLLDFIQGSKIKYIGNGANGVIVSITQNKPQSSNYVNQSNESEPITGLIMKLVLLRENIKEDTPDVYWKLDDNNKTFIKVESGENFKKETNTQTSAAFNTSDYLDPICPMVVYSDIWTAADIFNDAAAPAAPAAKEVDTTTKLPPKVPSPSSQSNSFFSNMFSNIFRSRSPKDLPPPPPPSGVEEVSSSLSEPLNIKNIEVEDEHFIKSRIFEELKNPNNHSDTNNRSKNVISAIENILKTNETNTGIEKKVIASIGPGKYSVGVIVMEYLNPNKVMSLFDIMKIETAKIKPVMVGDDRLKIQSYFDLTRQIYSLLGQIGSQKDRLSTYYRLRKEWLAAIRDSTPINLYLNATRLALIELAAKTGMTQGDYHMKNIFVDTSNQGTFACNTTYDEWLNEFVSSNVSVTDLTSEEESFSSSSDDLSLSSSSSSPLGSSGSFPSPDFSEEEEENNNAIDRMDIATTDNYDYNNISTPSVYISEEDDDDDDQDAMSISSYGGASDTSDSGGATAAGSPSTHPKIIIIDYGYSNKLTNLDEFNQTYTKFMDLMMMSQNNTNVQISEIQALYSKLLNYIFETPRGDDSIMGGPEGFPPNWYEWIIGKYIMPDFYELENRAFPTSNAAITTEGITTEDTQMMMYLMDCKKRGNEIRAEKLNISLPVSNDYLMEKLYNNVLIGGQGPRTRRRRRGTESRQILSNKSKSIKKNLLRKA